MPDMTTSTKPDLSALLERVRNAKGGPDTALGFDLAKAFESNGRRRVAQCNAVIEGSLNAEGSALFFFREKLPGWTMQLRIRPDGAHEAIAYEFDPPCRVVPKDGCIRGSTPALALLATILSALIAKGEG